MLAIDMLNQTFRKERNIFNEQYHQEHLQQFRLVFYSRIKQNITFNKKRRKIPANLADSPSLTDSLHPS